MVTKLYQRGSEDYQTYDGENGISVTYDANIWNRPSMSQEDTIGITTGNKLSYTAVLQVSDVYTDFWKNPPRN